jgi:putative transposase
MPARVSTRMLAPLSYIIGACLALVPDTSIFGIRVARELDRLLVAYGKPKTIASDNGTELTSTPSCGGLMTTRSNGITSHRGSRYRTPSPNPSSAACAMSCSMRRCSIRYRTPVPRSMLGAPTTITTGRIHGSAG